MAKTDIIRQFYFKNEKICRNLSFGTPVLLTQEENVTLGETSLVNYIE